MVLSADVLEQLRLVSGEIDVSKFFGLVLEFDLGKVVHVKLPDERAELVVLEIPWKNICFECFDVFNPEALSVLRPTDDVEQVLILEKLADWRLTWRISKVFVRKPGTEGTLIVVLVESKTELDISLYSLDFIIRNGERSKKKV